jgi:hypothetical protein
MPYFETPLKQTIPYEMNFDNNTGGKIAITIFKIDNHDRIAAAELLSVDAGARTTLTDTAGSRIERIILSVRPLPGNTAGVEIRQGTVSFPQSLLGDTDIVFDTVP